MNVQTIVTVVVALAAGVLGAVVVSPGDAPGGVDGVDIHELQTEIDQLARANERLVERLDTLESRPPIVQMATPTQALAAETVREVEEEPTHAAAAPVTNPVVLKEQVSSALEAIRADEERERDEEREKRRQERFEEQLAKLSKDLGLNLYQTNQLRSAMTQQTAKFEGLRDVMRETGDFGQMREMAGTLRDEMNTTLATFMNQEQIDKYNESNGGFRGFGGRGGRGGRDGGDGGGRGGF